MDCCTFVVAILLQRGQFPTEMAAVSWGNADPRPANLWVGVIVGDIARPVPMLQQARFRVLSLLATTYPDGVVKVRVLATAQCLDNSKTS
jgi:hypothetical protein